jgi:serine/threonine protein kinase HipA of HipAB toxin-antitoxin module
VTSARGHQDCEPGLDAMLNSIKHRLAFAFLYPEELIELVDLCTDVFTRLETHRDKLTVLGCVHDCTKRLVLKGIPDG